MTASTTCVNDYEFGPAVIGCRADFDFTQLFQRAILWSLPCGVFIFVSVLRLAHVFKRPRVVLGLRLQMLKCLSILVFIALQLGLLIISVGSKDTPIRKWNIVGSSLSFIAGIIMLLVSFADHTRSVRSSIVLTTYLFFSLWFDAAQTRSLWLMEADDATYSSFSSVFTTALATKMIVFALELYSKSRWIDAETRRRVGPESQSNIFNLAAYYWLRQLLWDGYHNVLNLSDLYPVNPDVSAEVAYGKLAKALKTHPCKETGHGLTLALFRAFSIDFLLPVIPRATRIGFAFSQSFLMQALMRHLESEESRTSASIGYGLIAATSMVYVGFAVSSAYKSFYVARLTSICRAALCAAIYRSLTAVSATPSTDAAPLTLMTTDIAVIQSGIQQIQEQWGNMVEIAIGCWLLYNEIGSAFVAPIVVALVCLVCLGGAMSVMSKTQEAWMTKIQERVGITSAMLSRMKSFKMLGIASRVGDLIRQLREDEIHAARGFRILFSVVLLLAQFPLAMAAAITFAFPTHAAGTTRLFASLSYIILLCSPLDTFIQGVPNIITARVSLLRVQKFLAKHHPTSTDTLDTEPSLDSSDDDTIELRPIQRREELPASIIFEAQDWSVGWTDEKFILNNVDLSVKTGSITVVTGPSACGKTTLCRALLGETPKSKGDATSTLSERVVGYCQQKPFLWNGTIQENIVGYSDFDLEKYHATLEATMLHIDMLTLPLGSETKVGNGGLALSGGQRQRVSLARALYANASVFILDDIFAGLDANTERLVYENVLGPKGIIRRNNATAILCTHSTAYLSTADHVIVLNDDGEIVQQGPGQSFQLSQMPLASHDGDKRAEEPPKPSAAANDTQREQELAAADISRKVGDRKVYAHYLKNLGWANFISLIVLSVAAGFASNFSPIWLNFWASNSFSMTRTSYLGIFAMICSVEIICIIAGVSVLFLIAVPRTARRLHNAALKTVLMAPLQLFTDTNTGAITNLFSQDLSLIDMDLPMNMANFMILFMVAIGTLFVVAVPAPYLAASYPFLLIVLYGIQMAYLRTSRQLRLLDLEAKSPLYDQFLETVDGISTIRSLGWVVKSIERNNQALNNSQRPAYLLSMAQNCLTTALNMIVAILATLLMALATQLKSNSGLTGASFISLLNFSGLLATLIRNYTELEIALGAINRLSTFSQVNRPELNVDVGEGFSPGPEWPATGCISLDNVSASYHNGDRPPTLHNITLEIKTGERVGLCGRTGSGKSSLLLLLLGFLEPGQNKLDIDGVPLQEINKDILRQRIITIPQDACFLPAGRTIKENLDIFNEATDAECTSALEQAGLACLVADGLHEPLVLDNISHGQQQLFSFARAMVKKKIRQRLTGVKSGIVFLDEPNSSIDDKTNSMMESLIKDEFGGYTVVLISHRLEMVVNICHRVIMLNNGRIVEQGVPTDLVKQRGGWFKKLWEDRSTS